MEEEFAFEDALAAYERSMSGRYDSRLKLTVTNTCSCFNVPHRAKGKVVVLVH